MASNPRKITCFARGVFSFLLQQPVKKSAAMMVDMVSKCFMLIFLDKYEERPVPDS
jgi:hypothetical protein